MNPIPALLLFDRNVTSRKYLNSYLNPEDEVDPSESEEYII
jgi:hypothetical protein